MKNHNIAVTSVSLSKNQELIEVLKQKNLGNIKLNSDGKRFSQSELIEFLSGCTAAIVGLDKINEDLLKNCPDLKTVSKYGVGLDNINFEDCEKYGVNVVHTQGVNKRSVAEMTLGFILALCRNLYFTSNQHKEQKWNKNGGQQLTGKTVGLIGIGNIGKDVIQLLKPFDCKILVNDIIDQKEFYQSHGLIESSKEEIFKTADVISIHTPLTDKTKNLINKDTLMVMKSSCYLINTARGGIVHQDDLKNALKNHDIAGAAIDAYEIEPPTDHDFIQLPNLIATPHIGGNAAEAVRAMGLAAIENLEKSIRQ